MYEFNPDGSIKLPPALAEKRKEREESMRNRRCLHVKRELVSFYPPKSCVLHIKLSERISDDRFISTIFGNFKSRDRVPLKLEKRGEREYDIKVGTSYARCSECSALVRELREFMDGSLIEERGSCTFEDRRQNFCYEDHFE